jgi:hypothetical protein
MSGDFQYAAGIATLAMLGYGGILVLLFVIFHFQDPEIGGILMIGIPVVLFGTLIAQGYTPAARRAWKMQEYKDLEDLRKHHNDKDNEEDKKQ